MFSIFMYHIVATNKQDNYNKQYKHCWGGYETSHVPTGDKLRLGVSFNPFE